MLDILSGMSALPPAVEGPVLRRILTLPEPLVKLLAGRPVRRDSQTLAPEMQLMLRLQRTFREPEIASLSIPDGRRAMTRQAELVGGRVPIASVRDLEVDGRPARLYTPREQLGVDAAPTLLFFHGGGWIYGDLDSHDAACRHLAQHSGVQVLAYDYRLAPEEPFPAAVEDCTAALRWLVAHAASVHADPARLAVGGDSAGGNLAALVAVEAAEEGLPLAFQLLIYPGTDFAEKSFSRKEFDRDFFLTAEFMDLATVSYLGSADRHDPRASVLRRTEFPAGIAPAHVVTAGFDPLRDEGEAYARLLSEHGVTVTSQRYPDMIHGFFNMVGAGRRAPAYNREIAARLGEALTP